MFCGVFNEIYSNINIKNSQKNIKQAMICEINDFLIPLLFKSLGFFYTVALKFLRHINCNIYDVICSIIHTCIFNTNKPIVSRVFEIFKLFSEP